MRNRSTAACVARGAPRRRVPRRDHRAFAPRPSPPRPKPFPSDSATPNSGTLVGELSEPDGRFPFDNFLSNETTIQTVIPALKARPGRAARIWASARSRTSRTSRPSQPKIAFIIDIRRQNMLEHLMYKALFELSDDRADVRVAPVLAEASAGLSGRSTAVELFGAFEKAPGRPGSVRRSTCGRSSTPSRAAISCR